MGTNENRYNVLPSMGGSGIIATELGIKMAERGHEVHFITSNIPFRIRKPLPNMTFHKLKSINMPYSNIHHTILH